VQGTCERVDKRISQVKANTPIVVNMTDGLSNEKEQEKEHAARLVAQNVNYGPAFGFVIDLIHKKGDDTFEKVKSMLLPGQPVAIGIETRGTLEKQLQSEVKAKTSVIEDRSKQLDVLEANRKECNGDEPKCSEQQPKQWNELEARILALEAKELAASDLITEERETCKTTGTEEYTRLEEQRDEECRELKRKCEQLVDAVETLKNKTAVRYSLTRAQLAFFYIRRCPATHALF
jgi:hypothetical protein